MSVLSSPGIESLSEELKGDFSGALLTVLRVTLDILLLMISCRAFLLENHPLSHMHELFLVALLVFFLWPFLYLFCVLSLLLIFFFLPLSSMYICPSNLFV